MMFRPASQMTLLAFAAATLMFAGPALAQQNEPRRAQAEQAQDKACDQLVSYLQASGSASSDGSPAPLTLEQARAYQASNNLDACRRTLAGIAQRAHGRAGVEAGVTPKDFAGGQGRQAQIAGGQGRVMQHRTAQNQRGIPSQFRQERGRIVGLVPVRVKNVRTPNYLVVVETEPGRRMVADIGQAIRGVSLRKGEPIAVRGEVVRVGDKRAVLLADAFHVGNRTYDVNRPALVHPAMQTRQGQRAIPSQFRQERGRIVTVAPARVKNVRTPNYLVVVETQPGRRVVADIGQTTEGMDLRKGVPIAFRGEVVRVGDRRAVLLADAVRIGNRVFDVSRPAMVHASR